MDLRWLLEREEETGDVGGEAEVSDNKKDTPHLFSINVKEESTAGKGDESGYTNICTSS